MVQVIPDNREVSKVGDKLSYNGLELEATDFFAQGKDAKNSGYEYFMFTSRGVLAFKEVA